jgi:hypothetical protein
MKDVRKEKAGERKVCSDNAAIRCEVGAGALGGRRDPRCQHRSVSGADRLLLVAHARPGETPGRGLRGPVRGLGLHLDHAAPDPAVRNLGGTRSAAAAWYGLSVGLLVASIFGLLFFWPNDMPSLALFAFTIAAGFVGGVIGRIWGI